MRKIKSVCVYCGTGSGAGEIYRKAAADLGRALAAAGIRLVYGGGKVGLMGIVSTACYEAGGEVVGIIPEHIQEKEIRNDALTELHVVNSMHQRKQLMVDKSDGFISLPGGFGTLDETFEILTWRYLGLHDKPAVFYDVDGFYQPLLRMVDHMVAKGFTPPHHRDMFGVVTSPEEAIAALEAHPGSRKPDIKHL